MNPKFFSVEEADRLVGFFERKLRLIVECGAGKSNPDTRALEDKTKKHRSLAGEIDKDIRAITNTGCILRDVDEGVIDFYSIMDDTVVFLCWKKGEDSVRYWHSIHDGFKGRQPLIRSSSK
jgi:hypothetical protein